MDSYNDARQSRLSTHLDEGTCPCIDTLYYQIYLEAGSVLTLSTYPSRCGTKIFWASLQFEYGKKVILKASNKIDSHREVDLPESISHLLRLLDHLTEATFVNIHITRLLQHMRQIHDDSLLHSEQLNTESLEQEDDANIVADDQGFILVPIFDDYAYRGEGFKDYCLYDYHSIFYKHNGRRRLIHRTTSSASKLSTVRPRAGDT